MLGHYVILDKMGQGGMGMALKAKHRRMKRAVALKMLSPSATKPPEAGARFQREVEAAVSRWRAAKRQFRVVVCVSNGAAASFADDATSVECSRLLLAARTLELTRTILGDYYSNTKQSRFGIQAKRTDTRRQASSSTRWFVGRGGGLGVIRA